MDAMETQQERKTRLDLLAKRVYFAALDVHRALGPGLLEKAYERALAHELGLRGIACATQVPLTLRYKGLQVDQVYFVDILVENEIVVEVKSTEADHEAHRAQLLTYLRTGDYRLGLLMNFKCTYFKNGVSRVANKL